VSGDGPLLATKAHGRRGSVPQAGHPEARAPGGGDRGGSDRAGDPVAHARGCAPVAGDDLGGDRPGGGERTVAVQPAGALHPRAAAGTSPGPRPPASGGLRAIGPPAATFGHPPDARPGAARGGHPHGVRQRDRPASTRRADGVVLGGRRTGGKDAPRADRELDG